MVSALNKRRDKDVTKILVSGYDVELVDENLMNELIVKFKGPADSPYEGGVWKVRVQLPDQYPHKSPSIGFLNRIYHPNIDEASGSVCLDVINQTWSPMFDLVNIFDVFLPQLLLYPNPTDPLNAEAAAMQLKNEEKYKEKIKQYVLKYAQDESASKQKDQQHSSQQPNNEASNGAVSSSQRNGQGNKDHDGTLDVEIDGSHEELSDTSDIQLEEDDEEIKDETEEV